MNQSHTAACVFVLSSSHSCFCSYPYSYFLLNVILILILILCFSEHRKVSQRVLDGALSLKESIAVANVLYSIL